MNANEWDQIVGLMAANWPHAQLPDEALSKWRHDLEDLPVEQVYTAIEGWYREGKPFPPNGGQVRQRIGELQRDDPDHGAAYELCERAIGKYGKLAPGQQDGDELAVAWVREHSPAAAEALRRYGLHDFRYEDTPVGTRRAQFRDIYNAVLADRERMGAHEGLPAGGLRRLERGPRRLTDVAREALPQRT